MKGGGVAQVNVRINGYTYTVGCEDGQEAHLVAMAAQVDQRIDSINRALGTTTSEQRLLVLSALLMADELHDLRAELDQLRAQLSKPARARAEAKSEADAARKLARLADQAEQIANGLERA